MSSLNVREISDRWVGSAILARGGDVWSCSSELVWFIVGEDLRDVL